MIRVAGSVLFVLFAAAICKAQQAPNDSVRVTVRTNGDGSQTSYRWDNGNHKASALTTEAGKVREKIQYVLDDAGRFVSGEVFDARGKLRVRTRYKYDSAGRLTEESQLNEAGTLLHRIVHTFDATGREIGYGVYDATGKLEHREGAP